MRNVTHIRTLFVVVFLISAVEAIAASSIDKICGNTRTIGYIDNVSQLEGSLKSLQRKFSDNPQISTAMNGFFKSEFWGTAKVLNTLSVFSLNPEPLKDLAALVDQAKPINAIDYENEVSLAIANLKAKYSTAEIRASKMEAYISDLRGIMEMTATGRETLTCFDAPTSNEIIGTEVFLPPTEDRASFLMELKILPSKSRPGLFKRTIFFNVEIEPVPALLIYAHELRHGCSANKLLESFKLFQTAYEKYQKAEPNSAKQLAALEDIYNSYQVTFLDELRAYKSQVHFFSDLALSDPSQLCNDYINSRLFGGQILSTGEIHAGLKGSFEKGTIHQLLLKTYSRDVPQAFFENGKGGALKASLQKKLEPVLKELGIPKVGSPLTYF